VPAYVQKYDQIAWHQNGQLAQLTLSPESTTNQQQQSWQNTYSRWTSESDLSPISLSESIEDATLRMLPTSITYTYTITHTQSAVGKKVKYVADSVRVQHPAS